MTLGGLALAIGILVDDSTVTIENTQRLLTEEGQPLPQATLHGSAGIAVPTLVSTLAISCVFTSVVFLEGPAKYLFTNRIPDTVLDNVIQLALDQPALSPRELAVRFTDTKSYFVSEASGYRFLKARDLIAARLSS